MSDEPLEIVDGGHRRLDQVIGGVLFAGAAEQPPQRLRARDEMGHGEGIVVSGRLQHAAGQHLVDTERLGQLLRSVGRAGHCLHDRAEG